MVPGACDSSEHGPHHGFIDLPLAAVVSPSVDPGSQGILTEVLPVLTASENPKSYTITAESMLVNTFCLILSPSTAVMTVWFLTLTTNAAFSIITKDSLEPLA